MIPLHSRVEQVAVDENHGAPLSRLHMRGQVVDWGIHYRPSLRPGYVAKLNHWIAALACRWAVVFMADRLHLWDGRPGTWRLPVHAA